MRKPGEICRWEFCKVRKDGRALWVRELARVLRSRERLARGVSGEIQI